MAREIRPNPNGEPLIVSVTIGQTNAGKYGVYLFEADRTTFRTVGTGDADTGNGVDLEVGDSGQLAGKFLTWDVVAAPVVGTRFSATLRATQGGKQLTQFTDDADVPSGSNFATIRASAVLK